MTAETIPTNSSKLTGKQIGSFLTHFFSLCDCWHNRVREEKTETTNMQLLFGYSVIQWFLVTQNLLNISSSACQCLQHVAFGQSGNFLTSCFSLNKDEEPVIHDTQDLFYKDMTSQIKGYGKIVPGKSECTYLRNSSLAVNAIKFWIWVSIKNQNGSSECRVEVFCTFCVDPLNLWKFKVH